MLDEKRKTRSSDPAAAETQQKETLAGADAWYAQYERGHGPQGSVLESLRYFMRVFDEAPAPYLITDLNLTISNANRAAQRLFGRNLSHLKGKPLGMFVAHSDQQAFRGIIAGDVREALGAISRPVRLRLSSGEAEVPFSASVLRDEKNSPECICWIFHDRHLAGGDDIL